MRVNVQLIDAETGNHLWAERFDKPLADLFDMQDEIVARLANALNTQLVAAEAQRAEQAPNPNSMDLYFQGRAWVNKGTTPAIFAQAGRFFDRALSADPNNVDALNGSAAADAIAGASAFVANPMAAFAEAEAKLSKALTLVPDHPRAHMYLGLVEIWTKRAVQGIAECEHALALDRNLASAHHFIGLEKFLSVAPRKPRLTSARPCGSVRAIRWLMSGWPRGPSEAPPRKLRAGSWVGLAVDRGQPEFSCRAFFVGRRPRAARSNRRGAFRSQGRLRAQPGLRYLPRPCPLDRYERRPDVCGPTRAHSRRHAQGRGPRVMRVGEAARDSVAKARG